MKRIELGYTMALQDANSQLNPVHAINSRSPILFWAGPLICYLALTR